LIEPDFIAENQGISDVIASDIRRETGSPGHIGKVTANKQPKKVAKQDEKRDLSRTKSVVD
jgi:hypothetical protein